MKRTLTYIVALLLLSSCSLEMDEPSHIDFSEERTYTIDLSAESKSDIYSTLDETDISNNVYAVYYKGVLVSGGTLGRSITLTEGFRYNLYVLSNCLGALEIPQYEAAMQAIEIPITPDGSIPKYACLNGMTPSQMDASDGSSDGRIGITLTKGFAKMSLRVNINSSIRQYYDEALVTEVRVVNGASTFCPFDPEARTLSNIRSGEWDKASSPSGSYYHLYMPENLQGDLLADNNTAEGKSREGLLSNGIDPSNCTYIEVSVAFHSTAGTGLDMVYRFYPGDDNTTNFDIHRNRTYFITLSLSSDGFNVTGTWKSELEDEYDNRSLYFSLPGGTIPSSWELFDNRDSSNPFVIAMNFSRDAQSNNSDSVNLTEFPYGYRLYVDGIPWTGSETLAPGHSRLNYSVDTSTGRISVYNGGTASAGNSMRLKIETIDGALQDEISVLVRRYNTFGYGILEGANPTDMYLGQYSRLAITLGSNWSSDFSTTNINNLTLQIRNAAGTSSVSGKFYFKNVERNIPESLINVSVVADAVYSGTLWVGNSSANIWKKVTDLVSRKPYVVYSALPGEYPVNLADGDLRSDIWTYANVNPDAEECVFYLTYTDANGRRLGGSGTFFDDDGYEGNLCVEDFIDFSYPMDESPSIDINSGGPHQEYDARVVVGYTPATSSDWRIIHQLDIDPDLSFAGISMSNATGNSLLVGLKVHPVVVTLANSYEKTSAYTYPNSDWYLKAYVDNTSGVPFSMDFNVYSRWELSDYVKPLDEARPYYPREYVYVDTYTKTRESYYASGIYLMTLVGHALFSDSKTWNGSTLDFFNGSITSNGFTGTLREFMDRKYMESGNYYVLYSAYNPTNGHFIETRRTVPTYRDCDYEVRINGEAAYYDFFRVVSNLLESAWPIVYGPDFYDLIHIYAFVQDIDIQVQ